jgi:hypothetical protein
VVFPRQFGLGGFAFAPVHIAAQQGDKAVWTLNAGNPTLAASSAWVDASAFCGSNGTNSCGSVDFCSMVSQALTQLLTVSPAGGVVDARGVLQVPAVGGGSVACNSNPFSPLQQTNGFPITIFLPPYTIQLDPLSGVPGTGTWTLPSMSDLLVRDCKPSC